MNNQFLFPSHVASYVALYTWLNLSKFASSVGHKILACLAQSSCEAQMRQYMKIRCKRVCFYAKQSILKIQDYDRPNAQV